MMFKYVLVVVCVVAALVLLFLAAPADAVTFVTAR